MRKFFSWLWHDAMNISSTLRLWRVDYGDWNGGRLRNFWLKKNAWKFAHTRSDIFVSIHNNVTNECIKVRESDHRQILKFAGYRQI
jgi:hypothetical protein